MRSISVERFSTDAAGPDARLAYWNDLASQTFNNLVVDAPDAAGFHGEMARAPLGELTLMSAHSSAASVSRMSDPQRTARGRREFDLHFQLEGHSLNSQGGRDAMLQTGDFTLCDASQPYRVRFTETNHMLCLKIPAETVIARLGDVESLVCLPMTSRQGGAAMLSSFLRTLWSQIQRGQAQDVWGEAVSDVIVDLLALAYRPMQIGLPETSLRTARRREAHAYIDRRLCDPDLGVSAIADTLGVSARYVQLLFAEAQTTPSAFILERRLDLAAERLRRGVGRGGVTEVALAVGFNDVTHFGRAFRRRFGVSPSDYNAGARAPRWREAAASPTVEPLPT